MFVTRISMTIYDKISYHSKHSTKIQQREKEKFQIKNLKNIVKTLKKKIYVSSNFFEIFLDRLESC